MRPSPAGVSASISAFNIAATADRPGLGHLVSREARDLAARFLAERPRFGFWLRMLRRPAFHRWFDRFEALAIPGMALHQALRNLSLEEAAIHGLEAGMDQVVVLGGGTDTLAARLARRYPNARFLDVDYPAALATKRKVLEQTGFLAPNLSLVPLDLGSHDLKAALDSLPEFESASPAFFICEGAFKYLERRGVEKILANLADLPCPALRLAFTFMEPDPRGSIAFRGASPLVTAWLRLRGEGFSWGLPARELPGFLARRGFALEEIADSDVFRTRFLSGHPEVALAEGEKVAIASVYASRSPAP
jgi:methyltransferase (TIGR00027 family)